MNDLSFLSHIYNTEFVSLPNISMERKADTWIRDEYPAQTKRLCFFLPIRGDDILRFSER